MIINFYKKITPTMRFRNRLVIFKNKNLHRKKCIKIILSKSGRNNTGSQTVYNKKFKIKTKNPIFSFLTPFLVQVFYLKWININTKLKKKFNIFSTQNNLIFYLPNILGSNVGLKINLFNNLKNIFSILHFGIPCYLKYIPNFFQISNIGNINNNKPTYANASGCFCVKIPKKKKDKLFKIILPSKVIKFINALNICFIGKNDLLSKKLLKPGKAGFNQNIGKKSTVRGIAKNPVDHPNGGRTNSCSPEKSP